MTKKQNTLVFLLVSTVVNIIILILLIIITSVLMSLLFKDSPQLALPVAFVASLILNIVLYQRLLKFMITKFKLTDKLDPLFHSKGSRK